MSENQETIRSPKTKALKMDKDNSDLYVEISEKCTNDQETNQTTSTITENVNLDAIEAPASPLPDFKQSEAKLSEENDEITDEDSSTVKKDEKTSELAAALAESYPGYKSEITKIKPLEFKFPLNLEGKEFSKYFTYRRMRFDQSKLLDFDVYSYADSYNGFTKAERVLILADGCPEKANEYLPLGLQLLNDHSKDYSKIVALSSALKECCGPESEFDVTLARKIRAEMIPRLNNLKSEIETGKTNRLNETVRLNYEELANLQIQTGDLKGASFSLQASKEYFKGDVSTNKLFISLVKVNLWLYDSYANLSLVQNLESIKAVRLDPEMITVVKIAKAIGALNQGEFKEAAMTLIGINYSQVELVKEFISAQDLSLIVAIGAVVSFSREEMRTHILLDTNLKLFQAHDDSEKLITSFINGNFNQFSKELRKCLHRASLDIYLQPHVPQIEKLIAPRLQREILRPYRSVPLSTLAQSFDRPKEKVYRDLMRQVVDGTLDARYEPSNETLWLEKPDLKRKLRETTLNEARKIERLTRNTLASSRLLTSGTVTNNPLPLKNVVYIYNNNANSSRKEKENMTDLFENDI